MRMPVSAAILLLALAGCGAKPPPAATAPDAASAPSVATAEEEPAQPAGAGGITAIDAATGDALAMPADSAAPSAYDLAQRAERSRDAEAKREVAAETLAEPARLGAPANLLGSDESVTAN